MIHLSTYDNNEKKSFVPLLYLLRAIGKTTGDSVKVVMDVDSEPRIVDVPEDFQQALDRDLEVKEIFEKFTYTHKKEYVEWIGDANRQVTRENHIKKAVEQIASERRS
jgi:uncharacterized protein YdeI (YjbR/CyaY-like superfamily)